MTIQRERINGINNVYCFKKTFLSEIIFFLLTVRVCGKAYMKVSATVGHCFLSYHETRHFIFCGCYNISLNTNMKTNQ